MKLNKIAEATYSFQDAIISGLYDKEEKVFFYTVERFGYYTQIVSQKNILSLSNKIESIYNDMKPVDTSVSVDDVSDEHKDLYEFIRSYTPENQIWKVAELPEVQDEVLLSLNKFLESKTDEDYVLFKEILDWELSQPKELAIA